MEIGLESRLRRREPLLRPDGRKRETGESAAAAPPPRTDRVSSQAVRQAVERLEEQSQRLTALLRQDQQEEKKPFLWDMLDGAEKTGDSEADALGEHIKTMERCHKIAARIMRGDKVPPEDEQYLMQNDPEGYKLALAMRRPKKHPKEWESVLKDEEKRARETGGDTAPEASSCEASGGAPDAGSTGGSDGSE